MTEPENSSVEPEALILRLVMAMESLTSTLAKQAEAIDRLASSNEELVDAMLQEPPDPEDEDAAQGLDMSGKRLPQ